MRLATVTVAFAVGLAFAAPAGAVKYMSIGKAVKKFVPPGSKVTKITKKLSGAEKRRIKSDYGWTADQSKYSVYVGKDKESGEHLGYVFVVPEIFNTCFHKYAIGLDKEGNIMESVIVELSCPRSFPIRKKAFLKQFKEKDHNDALTTGVDIDAITGATLSSAAAATAARKAVSLHNIFFGKNAKVAVNADVQAARKKANAMIQKAIDTGETLKKEGKEGAAQLPEDD